MSEPVADVPDSLTLDELRTERSRLQAEEDAVSYARRVAQTRLDLVRARLDPGTPDRPVGDQLLDVLSHQLLSPSGRPPRDTGDHADDDVATSLDALCAQHGFSRLDELDTAELTQLADALAAFEADVSSRRRELFASIDRLSADLVRRYRDGSADVDGLWRSGESGEPGATDGVDRG